MREGYIDRRHPEAANYRHAADRPVSYYVLAVSPMPHATRAFLLAPLTAPVVYWLVMMVAAVWRDAGSVLEGAPRALAVILAFGAPVAYAANLAIGVPLYLTARRWSGMGIVVPIVAGVISGAIIALVLEPWLRGDLFSVPLPVPLGMLLGSATAGVWWALARARPR